MTTEDIQTPEVVTEGTEVEATTENPVEVPAETEIDYKNKFSESSKEALRLFEENKAKDAEIERLRLLAESGKQNSDEPEAMYPGFETLSEEEQENLLAYTNSIKKGVREELYKDPAIAYSKKVYAETKWNEAFNEVATKYPELKEDSEFRQKYFNANNVPDNIGDILNDLAKVHLFDKARDIGAKDAVEKASHYEIERASGGDKTPAASRSLSDWHKMAQENPAEFAKNSKQYNEELASGKLK